MPPKQVIRSGSRPEKGFMSTAYAELTHPENFSLVKAVAVFGVGVGLLSTGLGELLLPPV